MAARYDPFQELDRLFANALATPTTASAMPLDLYREGDRFVAKLDLPGVSPETIDIDVDDRTLTIRAERPARQGEDIQWLTHERPTGAVARQLTVGRGLALDQIEASYDDGVLTLVIPVAEEAKPRKIAVEHARSGQQVTSG